MMATFYVGLTMAGAISAGAYNAGVFDFLTQALEAWEQRKKQLRDEGVPIDQWDVPSHDVVIPVMSGASAGGITGALGLVALCDAGAAAEEDHVAGVGTVIATLPRLYTAWVRLPCFVDPDGGPDLLGSDDLDALKEGEPVSSLLDTTLLWRIVESSLTGIPALMPERPYIGDNLHLYLTHTNLRGVPYAIRFLNDGRLEQGYGMLCHADRVHYTVQGIGSHDGFQSPWAAPEQEREISAATLPGLASVGGDEQWRRYAYAALGSGAFPVGLSARVIDGVTVQDYRTREWPTRRTGAGGAPTFDLQPQFPEPIGQDPATPVDYVAADGGVINNEPFELARWTLMKSPPDGNPRDALQADRAVIMIDPFPQAPEYDALGRLDASLAAVVKGLLPALKNQARFKPEDAADALDESIYSRFLIAPRRKLTRDSPTLEPYAIACGLLGGFGGFLATEFRSHDYQLGRLNACLFLKDSFALPLSKGDGRQVVLADGYGPAARLPQYQTTSEDPDHPGPFYQVIPVLPDLPTPPAWPRVVRDVVDTMVDRSAGRADGVFGNLRASLPSRLGRWAASLIWWTYGKGKVKDFVRWTVLQDLIRRDQLDGPSAGRSEAVRLTLAALADPSYDYRTAAGIAAQYDLAGDAVDAALNELRQHRDPALLWSGPRTGGGAVTYTLDERKPGWLSRLPIVSQLDEWVFSGPPVVD